MYGVKCDLTLLWITCHIHLSSAYIIGQVMAISTEYVVLNCFRQSVDKVSGHLIGRAT